MKKPAFMILATELLKVYSKENVNRIVGMVEADPGLFAQLVKLTLQPNVVLAQRASWVLTHCCDKMPSLLFPHFEELIFASPHFAHTGIRRNVLRMISMQKIPENLQGYIFDLCLQWVISKKEPVAVKVHAMEILAGIASEQPDLKNEVIPVIMDILPHGTMAIISRGKKILCKLGLDPDEIKTDY
ncbi:MAG: hypothetical protein HC905_28670 [Bacteroidales bacterium]|nr:hypothetical protein [Bacteroidales bacterium]